MLTCLHDRSLDAVANVNREMEGITADRIIETADGLDQEEFTRADLANELGVKPREIKEGFRAARESGRVEKVRAGEDGKPLFRLVSQ